MALEGSLLNSRSREMDEVCMFRRFTIGSGEMWKRPMRLFRVFNLNPQSVPRLLHQ